jgi:hypothetical protein
LVAARKRKKRCFEKNVTLSTSSAENRIGMGKQRLTALHKVLVEGVTV